MIRLLRPAHLCTLALLLVVPAARAASFDCAKATRPQEKLVCADARLSALDEAISAAYRDARTKLSPAAWEAVQSGQKAWNAWWPRAQSSDPRTVKLGRGETYTVTLAFEERLKALQVTTGFDGKFTTYDVALYTVLAPDPELESRSAAAHEWRYPQLDLGGLAGTGPQTVAIPWASFQPYLTEFGKAEVASLKAYPCKPGPSPQGAPP